MLLLSVKRHSVFRFIWIFEFCNVLLFQKKFTASNPFFYHCHEGHVKDFIVVSHLFSVSRANNMICFLCFSFSTWWWIINMMTNRFELFFYPPPQLFLYYNLSISMILQKHFGVKIKAPCNVFIYKCIRWKYNINTLNIADVK